MDISPVSATTANVSQASPGSAAGAAAMKAMKASMEIAKMEQAGLAMMMRQITPHLGQNIDVRA